MELNWIQVFYELAYSTIIKGKTVDVYRHEYKKIIVHGVLPWKWARTQKKNFVFNILDPLTNSIANLYRQSLRKHKFYNQKSFFSPKGNQIHITKGNIIERQQAYTDK